MNHGGGAVVLSPRARQALFAQPAFRHLGTAERTQATAFFREIRSTKLPENGASNLYIHAKEEPSNPSCTGERCISRSSNGNKVKSAARSA